MIAIEAIMVHHFCRYVSQVSNEGIPLKTTTNARYFNRNSIWFGRRRQNRSCLKTTVSSSTRQQEWKSFNRMNGHWITEVFKSWKPINSRISFLYCLHHCHFFYRQKHTFVGHRTEGFKLGCQVMSWLVIQNKIYWSSLIESRCPISQTRCFWKGVQAKECLRSCSTPWWS